MRSRRTPYLLRSVTSLKRNFHPRQRLRGSVVNSRFPPWSLPQLVGLLKLLRQLPRSQILADMRQPLFHFKQRILQILLVADRDVPPHRVWTRGNPRHLLQRPASGGEQRRFFSKLLDQRRSQRSGYHLGEMADPAA